MSNISIFNFESTKQVRTAVHEDGGIWFCLPDVASVLDIQNSRDIVAKQLDRAGVEKIYISYDSGKKQVTFVNEPNLYRVIFRSNKDEAVKFQNWVFDEVLPTIRKTGQYRHTISVEQQAQIRHAIAKRCKSNREHYQSVYTALHQEFNIPRYNELLAVDFERAMAFINDYRIGVNTDALILAAQYLSWHTHFIHSWFSAIYPYFRAISPKLCGEIHSHIIEAQSFAKSIHRQVGFRDMNVDVLKKKTWSVNQ